jgi:hypothetical protein
MPKKASEGSSGSVVLSCRVHTAIRDEIDELIPSFAASPELCPSGDISRADVVRMLLLKGLETMKGEQR